MCILNVDIKVLIHRGKIQKNSQEIIHKVSTGCPQVYPHSCPQLYSSFYCGLSFFFKISIVLAVVVFVFKSAAILSLP